MMPYTITQHPVCSSLFSSDNFFSISCVQETEVTQQCNLLITKLPLTKGRLLKKHTLNQFWQMALVCQSYILCTSKMKNIVKLQLLFPLASTANGEEAGKLQSKNSWIVQFCFTPYKDWQHVLAQGRPLPFPTSRKPFGGNEVISFQPFTFGSWSWGSFNMRVIHICTSIPTLFS